MSIPNLITLGRILLVPIVVWAISSGAMWIAFVLFLAAGVSDDIDGFLAKRFGMTTVLGSYLDPLMAGHGADEIAGMIGAAQAQFPGHRFELSSGPDAHHDVVRFAWTLRGADGPVAHGVDFATVAGDGRLREVTGFLESA